MADAPVRPDAVGAGESDAATQSLRDRVESMSRACRAARSVDELVAVAVAQAKSAIDATGGLLFTVEGDHLALAASDGYAAGALRGWLRFPVDASTPAGRAARERRPVWVTDPSDRYSQYPALNQEPGEYRALAVVPVLAGPSVLAVLGISFDQVRALSPAEQLLLLVLADQMAAALDRLRRPPGGDPGQEDRTLIDDVTRRDTARSLRAVLAASGAHVSRMTAMASELAEAPAASLTLIDTGPVVVSHAGVPLPADLPVFAEDAVATVALRAPGPFVVTDARADDRVKDMLMVRSGAVGAYLGVPLSVSGFPVGVLGVYDQRSRTWTAEAAEALTLLGEAVSAHLQAQLLAAREARVTRSRERQLRLLDRLGSADGPREVAKALVSTVMEDPDVVAAMLAWSDEDSALRMVEARAADPAGRAALAALAAAEVPADAPDLELVKLADLVRMSSADAARVVGLGARSAVRLRLRWQDATAVLLVLPAAAADPAVTLSSLELMAPVATMALDRATSQERHRLAAARAAFLAAAAAQMGGSSLDLNETLQRLARIIVPTLADGCLIHLRQSGKLRMAAASHVSAQVERRMRAELPGDRELASWLGAAADGREATGAVPSWLTVPGRLRVIPLRARGRLIGSIALVDSASAAQRRLADPPVVETLAAHAAVTIDNALLYAKRSADVAALQHGLLPARLPAVASYDLAAYYEPGDRTLEVGGDFYDVISLADDHAILVIGDVCGSGADAASMTGPARAVLRTVLEDGASPAQALARLNHALFDASDGVKFCTAAVVELRGGDQGEARLRMASAGHPLPLLRRDGRVEEIGEPGPFLGVLEGLVFPEYTRTVRADDVVVMYTDGVIEARHGDEMFETRRLAGTVTAAGQAAEGILAAVVRAVARFRNRGNDDIAMLALRVRGRLIGRVEVPDLGDEDARAACAQRLGEVLPASPAAARRDLTGKVQAALAEVGAVAGGPATLDVLELPGRWRAELSQPARPAEGRQAAGSSRSPAWPVAESESQMRGGSRTLVVLEVTLSGD